MTPATEAMAGYLNSFDFQYFTTFTTRKPVSLPGTRRIAEQLATTIDAGITTTMFWAAEEFDVREGFHFHALLNLNSSACITPQSIWAWYFERYGRCQIINNTDPNTRQSAGFYCAKYITKRLADYDLYVPGMTDPPQRRIIF